jgi:hypothetical protein
MFVDSQNGNKCFIMQLSKKALPASVNARTIQFHEENKRVLIPKLLSYLERHASYKCSVNESGGATGLWGKILMEFKAHLHNPTPEISGRYFDLMEYDGIKNLTNVKSQPRLSWEVKRNLLMTDQYIPDAVKQWWYPIDENFILWSKIS